MIRYVDRQTGMFLEGEQAEAYKKRKAEEAAQKKQAEKDEYKRNMARKGNQLSQDPKIQDIARSDDSKVKKMIKGAKAGFDSSIDDYKALKNSGSKTAQKIAHTALASRSYSKTNDAMNAADAIARHNRRHPKSESVHLEVNGLELF